MAKKVSRISKIPAFIKKLLAILQDLNFKDYVEWLPQDNGFHIINVGKFTEEVLPKYFKHQNMASFVRQLNMYGFNRTKDSEQHVYFHPKFKKGQMGLIKNIKRKNITKKKDDKQGEMGSQSEIEESISEINQIELGWEQKYEELINQNGLLRRQNHMLKQKVNQLQLFKMNMSQLLSTSNQQKLLTVKNQRQPNTSSSSDKSDTRPPTVKQQQIKIQGSSFGFCGNLNTLDQKQSYQKLVKGEEQHN